MARDWLAETEEARRPPVPTPPARGPFRPGFWRSPLRGEWLTAFLGSALMPLLVVCGLTGFVSHSAYDPDLGANAITGGFERDFFFWDWPTNPVWLYSVTQGLHVLTGLAAIPILLAKLWSVIPRLFESPPARSIAQGLERLSIATLVGSSILLFGTGTLNIAYWLPFPFPFVPAHYYASYIFIAALTLHVALKLPIVSRAFRREGTFHPLGKGVELMRAADRAEDGLAASEPAAPTISRRGLVATVGAGSLGLAALNVGTNLLPFLRETSLLSSRGTTYGDGPNDFQVNKTAESAGIDATDVGGAWRLELRGGNADISLSRADLAAMDQYTERLPIACVEGWTTYQDWTGVRLRDLAASAGVEGEALVLVESIQESGTFNEATLNSGQLFDERSLLALRVNGADLSLDHGFPARVIVPALPGVHNTKWVRRMTFQAV